MQRYYKDNIFLKCKKILLQVFQLCNFCIYLKGKPIALYEKCFYCLLIILKMCKKSSKNVQTWKCKNVASYAIVRNAFFCYWK